MALSLAQWECPACISALQSQQLGSLPAISDGPYGFQSLGFALFGIDGKLDTFVNGDVNGEDIFPEGLNKPVKDGNELSIKLVEDG